MQRVSVALDSTPEKLSIQNRIARSLTCYLNNRKVDIAVCGNLFLSGNYGVFIKEGAHSPLVYEHIAQEMKPLQTQKKASIFFLKDFKNEELSHLSKVGDHQFQPFQVEPNMQLKLVWDSFQTYKEYQCTGRSIAISGSTMDRTALKRYRCYGLCNHRHDLPHLSI